jgi:RNA polymerase sigma-70 factor (ECF subfamily)
VTQVEDAVELADLGDPELMRRVQAGNAEAFGVLYDRFAAPARRLARALVCDTHADDIVQEAFISVWRNSAAFHPDLGTVPAWVMGTVRNRAIDALRRQAKHDKRRADANGLERLHAPGNVENETTERDQAARLRRTLASLPDAQRDVITLAYFGELSTSEIAQELSLPLGTVKGRMRLGLDKLRVPMNEERSQQ